jgi:hypothetical protein
MLSHAFSCFLMLSHAFSCFLMLSHGVAMKDGSRGFLTHGHDRSTCIVSRSDTGNVWTRPK